MALLEVNNLEISFRHGKKYLTTVNGVSFHVNPGETLGIVGESGCGKSVTSLSIMGLLPENLSKIGDTSEILFEGKSLTKLSQAEYQQIRGKDIAMIFQDPMTSLNPVLTIGYQMIEQIVTHEKVDKKTARERAAEMLEKVGIPRPEKVLQDYPHQLSGGMRQRVMIAMALSCNPKLLIADEPTTALDVTIQAQILELMKELQDEFNTSIMFITHDLGVVAEICDRVIVMYAGEIIEEGTVEDIFNNPSHPYTIGLLNSIPDLEREERRLQSIPGSVPTPDKMPTGCRFSPRCKHATEKCRTQKPEFQFISEKHQARCWLHSEEGVEA